MTCREIDAAQTTHESKTLVSKHDEFTVDIKPLSSRQSQQAFFDTHESPTPINTSGRSLTPPHQNILTIYHKTI
jgi:hypothetical protein